MGKKRETKQAAKHSLHQLRKRRHIGPKCHESPTTKGKRKWGSGGGLAIHTPPPGRYLESN
jgi:hypothetical protein